MSGRQGRRRPSCDIARESAEDVDPIHGSLVEENKFENT